MSSIELLRNAELKTKRKQLLNSVGSRKRCIEELYRATYLYNNPAHALQPGFDAPTVEEVRVLDENDIEQGRHFNESTIPTVAQNVKVQLHPPKQPASSPSPRRTTPAQSSEIAIDAAKADRTVDPEVAASHSLPSPTSTDPHATDDVDMARLTRKHRQHLQKADSPPLKDILQPPTPVDLSLAVEKAPGNATNLRMSPDGPTIDPHKALSLTADDRRTQPGSELSAAQSDKPPKVVHLPPKEVQERHLKEIEQAQEDARRREKKEDERLTLSVGVGATAEAASSPSSTVGAHSTFTPHPTHNSPDTSPDTEMSVDSVENLGAENTASPSTLSAAREHQDRILQARLAHSRTFDVAPTTPDEQLRFEEEQAIRNARDGPKNTPIEPSDITRGANEVVNDMQNAVKDVQNAALATITKGSMEVSEVEPANLSEGDTIAVRSPQHASTLTQDVDADADVEMEDAPSIEQTVSKQTTERPPEASLPQQKPVEEQFVESAAQDSQAVSILPSPKSRRSMSSPKTVRKLPQTTPGSPKDLFRLSSVTFLKPSTSTIKPSISIAEDFAALEGTAEEGQRDYLVPLFTYQAQLEQHRQRGPVPEERKFKGQGQPLQYLIQTANKTCSTSNHYASIRESQESKILKRIYHLQNANRWALRQLERCEEPKPEESFLDHLMLQMKAMRTDFREERKLKTAVARELASWCAEWHSASPEERVALQVKVKPIPPKQKREEIRDSQDPDTAQPTPDLIPSGATETDMESIHEDEMPFLQLSYVEPTATLFTKDPYDTFLEIAESPMSNDLLSEIPLYQPTLLDMPTKKEEIPPVTKFVTNKLVSTATGPPRKRSRYDYEADEKTEDTEYPSKRPSTGTSTSGHATPMTPGFLSRRGLEPEMSNVALFAPSNRHLLRRLHDSHAFRPPGEFIMPSTAFLAARLSSQWTWEEDQKLRQLVRDYSYNWSLISDELKSKSRLESQADRRTPWECFERWAGLEGLPQEMHKTSYFKTWFSRLDAASAAVERQQRLQQNQPGSSSGSVSSHPGANNINGIQGRKRHRVPIRIEKKHNGRYLHMLGGIVRRMRKAEAAAHKQAENAKAAQMRKNQAQNDVAMNGPKQPKIAATPQELSKIRADRDAKMKEKADQYRQQMELQRQAMHNGQRPGQPVAMGMQQQQRAAMQQGGSQASNAPGNPHINTNSHSQVPQNGNGATQMRLSQQQQLAAMQAMGMGTQGLPQAHQANMGGQMRGGAGSPEQNLRVAMGHRAMQANGQQAFPQLQQGLNQNSLAAAHMAPANAGMQNPAVLAALSNLNGGSGTARQGNSASPRMSQPNAAISNNSQMNLLGQNSIRQPQQLSSGLVPAVSTIRHQISAANPQLTDAQIGSMTAEQLKNHANFASLSRQAAMSAAAGTPGMNHMNGNLNHMMPSPSGMQSGYANMGQTNGNQNHSPQQHYQASQAAHMRQMMAQQQSRNQVQSPQMMQRMPNSGSPVNMGASPSMGQARPVSRNSTPGMQRQGSGSGMNMGSPMMGQAGMR